MASADKAPMAITKGDFKGLAHETKGVASIYQLADGKRTLRLANFETSNGPDVHVYLTVSEVAKGIDAIKDAGFIDLGSMKGNKGDQKYDVAELLDKSLSFTKGFLARDPDGHGLPFVER